MGSHRLGSPDRVETARRARPNSIRQLNIIEALYSVSWMRLEVSRAIPATARSRAERANPAAHADATFGSAGSLWDSQDRQFQPQRIKNKCMCSTADKKRKVGNMQTAESLAVQSAVFCRAISRAISIAI